MGVFLPPSGRCRHPNDLTSPDRHGTSYPLEHRPSTTVRPVPGAVGAVERAAESIRFLALDSESFALRTGETRRVTPSVPAWGWVLVSHYLADPPSPSHQIVPGRSVPGRERNCAPPSSSFVPALIPVPITLLPLRGRRADLPDRSRWPTL